MLSQLNAHLLNHLLTQNTWATERLTPYAGKVIELALPPLRSRLRILGNGQFDDASGEISPHATLRLNPGAALRFLADRQLDATQLAIEGDTELATAVGKVLQNLRWDVEEDLSRVIGDIPAHQLTQAGTRIRQEIGRQATSVAGMFAEYWLEEEPLIAKKPHLAQFSRDVDALREDAERLEKRLQRLEQSRP